MGIAHAPMGQGRGPVGELSCSDGSLMVLGHAPGGVSCSDGASVMLQGRAPVWGMWCSDDAPVTIGQCPGTEGSCSTEDGSCCNGKRFCSNGGIVLLWTGERQCSGKASHRSMTPFTGARPQTIGAPSEQWSIKITGAALESPPPPPHSALVRPLQLTCLATLTTLITWLT